MEKKGKGDRSGLWWKALGAMLVLYAVGGGMLLSVPRLPILNETVRNLHYHVPMWFGMIFLLGASAVYSIRYLSERKEALDFKAVETANVGILFGILGLATGAVWARHTWGSYWSGDPKQNAAAIGLMIYVAYSILRGAFQDEQQRARVSAVYNVFAFAAFVPLIFVLPRLADSLHPGAEGNPAFAAYDYDNFLRLVFYPAVIGWTLLGAWMAETRYRLRMAARKLEEAELERLEDDAYGQEGENDLETQKQEGHA